MEGGLLSWDTDAKCWQILFQCQNLFPCQTPQAVVLMALELCLGLSRGLAADGLFSTVSSCMTSSFNSSLVLRNLYTITYLEISSYKFCIRAMISSQICLLPLELICTFSFVAQPLCNFECHAVKLHPDNKEIFEQMKLFSKNLFLLALITTPSSFAPILFMISESFFVNRSWSSSVFVTSFTS